MFYRLLRVIATISLKIYFRKIYLSGFENIPQNQVVIYISNHPNGFFEPCILACFLPKSLHYLVRGDLFANPVLKILLNATHQIPIYRFRDGFSNLRQNNKTIENCYRILRQNKPILIFAEGSTEQVRWIRPLRKGTARIALGTMSNHPDLNIKIVPVGVNFTKPAQWRSEVMINIGNSISLEKYLDDFRGNPSRVIKKLTDDLYPVLKEANIHCQGAKEADIYDLSLDLFSSPYLMDTWPVTITNSERYANEIGRSRKLNMMSDSLKSRLREIIESYFSKLRKGKFNDLAVVKPSKFITVVFAILFAPVFLLGFILNFLPVTLGKIIANKYVDQIEFYSSIVISAGLGIYIIYIAFLLILGLMCFGLYGLLVLFVPVLGYFSIIYLESILQYIKSRNFLKLKNEEKEELIRLRGDIVKTFNSI